jgi:hypothetical protein
MRLIPILAARTTYQFQVNTEHSLCQKTKTNKTSVGQPVIVLFVSAMDPMEFSRLHGKKRRSGEIAPTLGTTPLYISHCGEELNDRSEPARDSGAYSGA